MRNSRRLSLLLVLAIFLQLLIPVKLAFAEEGKDLIKEEQLEEIELEDKGDGEEDSNLEKDDEVSKDLDKENQEEGISEEGHLDKNDNENTDENKEEDNKTEEETEETKHGFTIVLDRLSHLGENEINQENPLDLDEDFFIHYSWELDNKHNYKEGDQVSFNLPKGIKILKEQSGQLRDSEKQAFANYSIGTDGKVIFTFQKIIEDLSDIKGDINIKSKLDKENAEIEDGNLILRPHEEGGHIEVPIKEDQLKANISKKGQAIPLYNPKEIKWTIEVDTDNTSHSEGIIKDILPDGLSYKKASMEGAEEPKINGQELEINLGDFKGKKVITFTTIIEEKAWSKFSFTNRASYKSKNSKEIETSSTVSFNRGKPLNKKGGSIIPKKKL